MTISRSMRSWFVLLVAAFSLAVLAAGCGPAKIAMPPYSPPTNIAVSPNAELQPVGFQGVTLDLERGSLVRVLPTGYADHDFALCNTYRDRKIYYTAGTVVLKYPESYVDAFFDALDKEGYDVAGDPSKQFEKNKDRQRAVYEVRARIVKLAQNVCNHHAPFNYRDLGVSETETDLTVEWEVYDLLREKSMLKVKTRGYQPADKVAFESEVLSLIDAFYGAAQELANNKLFYELVSKPREQADIVAKESEVLEGDTGDIFIPYVPLSRSELSYDAERFQKSTVIVRDSNGHGSGFVVSKNGLIVTNAHVVGDNKEVIVEFYGGFAMPGKVLRRHKVRDVALIKVDVTKALPLAMRPEQARIAETVYAIGAPKYTDLGWSVVKGTVSSIRKNQDTGLKKIQVDMGTHHGNSGGPLLDEYGNLLGLCVTGAIQGSEGLSTNINFFIPIHDAFDMLGLKVSAKGKGREKVLDAGQF